MDEEQREQKRQEHAKLVAEAKQMEMEMAEAARAAALQREKFEAMSARLAKTAEEVEAETGKKVTAEESAVKSALTVDVPGNGGHEEGDDEDEAEEGTMQMGGGQAI
jgi:hypothetical protein